MKNNLTRRDFIQTLMTGVLLGPAVLHTQASTASGIPTRAFGNSGEHISIIGFGGWDLGYIDEKLAIRMMHKGIDEGVRFIDNAWEYNNGRSEEVVGKGLKQGNLRDKVFLMTKVCARDYKGALSHLEDALRRLNTDTIDLVQLHSIQYDGDRQRAFDPDDGAIKALVEARKEGKLRFIGFSGHRAPQIHLDMLSMDFDWDAVQLPLNVLDAHYNSFQKRVLPVLNKRNIAALGMKSLAGGFNRISDGININAELSRRYALSLPVSTVICGMQTMEELQMMIDIGRNFKPLSKSQLEDLLDKSEQHAMTGKPEAYKLATSGYGCGYHSRVLSEGQG